MSTEFVLNVLGIGITMPKKLTQKQADTRIRQYKPLVMRLALWLADDNLNKYPLDDGYIAVIRKKFVQELSPTVAAQVIADNPDYAEKIRDNWDSHYELKHGEWHIKPREAAEAADAAKAANPPKHKTGKARTVDIVAVLKDKAQKIDEPMAQWSQKRDAIVIKARDLAELTGVISADTIIAEWDKANLKPPTNPMADRLAAIATAISDTRAELARLIAEAQDALLELTKHAD